MLVWVSPTAALPAGATTGTFGSSPSDSARSSAASSPAPRSWLVSTYSGTTSRSSPGKTTRCRTRRPPPAGISSATAGLRRPGGAEPAERDLPGEERAQPVAVHAQRGGDGHVHVQVLVRAQPAAEQHAGLAAGHLPVLPQLGPVFGPVDGVVRFVAAAGEPGELAHDHCLVLWVPGTFGMEVPELVNTGERDVLVRVVHDGRALEVPGRQHVQFEVQGPPAEVAGA